MSALNFSHSWRPADDAEQENPIPSPIARETAKATRETNSAQKTRIGLWAPPTAEDHAAKPRDRAKQNRPLKGRHGSSSIDRQRLEPLGIRRGVRYSEALQPAESAQNIFKRFARVNPFGPS